MKGRFDHFNFNVLDLTRSMAFYEEAFELREVRRVETPTFTLVFLGDGLTDYQLELTYLKDRKEPYDLGEIEYHLCLSVEDIQTACTHHDKMGCVCYENKERNIYFVRDPDGYWIEVVGKKWPVR